MTTLVAALGACRRGLCILRCSMHSMVLSGTESCALLSRVVGPHRVEGIPFYIEMEPCAVDACLGA